MKHLIYDGGVEKLKGETALVRDNPESRSRMMLAQFDNFDRFSGGLAHGWHRFYAHEFKEVSYAVKVG